MAFTAPRPRLAVVALVVFAVALVMASRRVPRASVEDNTNPAFFVPGQLPTMWLHVGMAISIQEMRPLQ